jgi:hypothetical protein
MEKKLNLDNEGEDVVVTLKYFLALSFADIDIFLLKEENQVDDKDKLFTVNEIREHLLNTLQKMLNVARELNIDIDKSLYSPSDIINKYPKGFFTKKEEDFLNGLRKTL